MPFYNNNKKKKITQYCISSFGKNTLIYGHVRGKKMQLDVDVSQSAFS